ncbi:MAG: hypothetical protein M1826_006063 [Phylliscum demangeonii]|nr:MAG: hypothetical protein M1826_006063 [Phylliscum demangeonii]
MTETDPGNDPGKDGQAQPESHERSPPPERPAVNEHCVSDSPLLAGEASSGEISKLGDVNVYITRPSDYPHAPSKLLLLLTNGTGIHSLNNQLQADKYAAEGFLVVMPDM